MTPEEIEESRRAYAAQRERYHRRPVDTVFVDGIIGIAHSGGVLRLTLGREIFNDEPFAEHSIFETAAIMAIPLSQVQNFVNSLVQYQNFLISQAEIDASV